MALGGILGAALTNHAAHPRGVFLDNLDVGLQPAGNPGNGYGIPIDTIVVTEQGPPAGVSSMSFTIDDPLGVVTMAESMEVRFYDFAADHPEFQGWVQDWHVVPWAGVGRSIAVTAIGVEVLLDWCKLPADVTFASGTLSSTVEVVTALQSIVASIPRMARVRPLSVITLRSDQDHPIDGGSITSGSLSANLTIKAGTTVREAYRQIMAARTEGAGAPADPPVLMLTIDFWFGLRTWQSFDPHIAVFDPLDYATLTVPAGALVPSDLDYSVDGGSVVRSVIVNGTGVSVTVDDGTGLPGETRVITDDTITTTIRAQAVGQGYLAQYRSGLRGSFDLVDHTPVAGIHAGSPSVITDAQTGLAALDSPIHTIEKRYLPVRETWSISFGGPQPSVARLIRRLTKDALS